VVGIVLSAMPYREKDKIIQIYTVELGKVSAILKGVSSPKSKLKFAGQPFCFAKFDLTGSRDIMTVKGVELIDSFFDLTSDYDCYALASSMLEVCSVILKPGIIMEGLFLSLIKSLQNIVYNNIDCRLSTLKFYLSALTSIGYALNFNACDNCGMSFLGDIKFSVDSGTFRCSACAGGYKIEKKDFMTMKIVSSTSIDRLHTIKISNDSIVQSIKLILQDLSNKLNIKLRSVNLNNII
jgi:DNA repair protein RecO (recombination protein O)